MLGRRFVLSLRVLKISYFAFTWSEVQRVQVATADFFVCDVLMIVYLTKRSCAFDNVLAFLCCTVVSELFTMLDFVLSREICGDL